MRTEVVMPQMGESVAEGTLTAWLKEVGESVERNEPLFEITTDKVDAEIPSPVEGVLVERLVEPGQTVEINTVVAILETEASAGEAAPGGASSAAKTEEPAGAQAEEKAQAPARQPALQTSAGGVSGLGVTPGASREELRRTRSTPLVRRIAQAHGIEDLSGIPGSGLSGRVTRDDIQAWIERGGARQDTAAPAAAARPAVQLPEVQIGPRDRVEALSPQRKAIAEHMVASKQISPHAYTIHEVDFGQVVAARNALKAEFAERGVKLTYTAFLVKAIGQALVEFPSVNAAMSGESVVLRGDVNVGMAVALDKSLIVPVIKHVDELSLLGVARAVNDIAERARSKRLTPDEVRGGTFTLSNHGIFGPEFGIPVINQPQAAIISTGAIKKRVVVDQKTDAIMVRPTSMWCLSFDHRVIDGATADQFVRRMREIIETWSF